MKKIFTLLAFVGLLLGRSFAQTGGFCNGSASSLTTYLPNVPYVAGNAVIQYGVIYQATGSSTGQFPCAGGSVNSSYWTTNIGSSGGGAVDSVFGRTGTITATSGDYTVGQVTGAAPLASPALTGVPTAPTAAVNTNTTQIATTAFVLANAGPQAVSSVFTRTGAITATSGDYTVSQVTGAAPLASPALTGTPTAPTASNGTNNTQIATTAFALANGPVASVFTRTGTVSAQSGDYTVSQVTGAAPLASPALTGVPTAPTAAVNTNTTQVATTAFVLANAGTSVWSALTNPTGNLALSMGSDTSTFTFGATTGTTDLFKFTDGASNTGTGNLVHFTTASGSTENPWAADANGVGWQINDTGQLVSVGTGGTATIALAGSTSGTASIVSQATAGTPTLTLPTTTGTFADSASAPLSLSATTGVLTISSIPLSDMATQGANTVVANVTGSTAVPSAAAIPSGLQNYVAGTGYNQATAHQVAAPLACADTSGSGTAQSCTTSPSFTPAANDCVIYTTTTANTGALTLNVNASAADAVQKWLGTAVASGDVPANHAQLACLDGSSHWQLSTIGNAPSGGGLPSGTTGQTIYYASGGTTGTATSAIFAGGAAAGSNVGIGVSAVTVPITTLEVAGPQYQDVAYTGTVLFTAGCAGTVTSPSTCAISGGTALPPNGVIYASEGSGGNNQEYICYSAVTSTTITPGGGNCQTVGGNANGRGYWGSSPQTHNNNDYATLVTHALVASDSTQPYSVAFGGNLSGSFLIGQANPQYGGGILFGQVAYTMNNNLCWLHNASQGNGTCFSYQNGSMNFSNTNNNQVLVTGGSGLTYSIATQTISTTATLTAITNAVTPQFASNSQAAAAGTGGVLSSHCHIIWSQATGGTVSFAVKASAAPTRLDVTETDYAGTGGIALGSFVAQNITSTTTTLTSSGASNAIVPAAFGTVYYSDITLTMNPGTSNSPSVALYAESSNSSDTLSLYAGTGCSGWN